tara:strand:+ start:2031 stop:3395 length:1365 start_codon:yes stop_codon:yes gene_type:complete
MKEIFETYRTTELRGFVNEYNKKVKRIVKEDLKKIKQNILDKRLINVKRKKRSELINVMVENKRFFKHIKSKPQLPKKDVDYILDKILQPKLTIAFNDYVNDKDLDELEDRVKEIRKMAQDNGLKTFHTKAKMITMILSDVPKVKPPRPIKPPMFIWSSKSKMLVLRERPKQPTRAPPPRPIKFDPAEVHKMNGENMTGKTHNSESRPLTDEEEKRLIKYNDEVKAQKIRVVQKLERERQKKEKEEKQKKASENIRNPKKRAKILRVVEKRLIVSQKKLDEVLKLSGFTEREETYLNEVQMKIDNNDVDEKDVTRLGRLLKKYKDNKEVVKPKKPKKPKAPPKPKGNPKIIKEYNVDSMTQKLLEKAMPLDDYDMEDQEILYEKMLEHYTEILLDRTNIQEIKEDEVFPDDPEFKLFEYMFKNNLFMDKNDIIKETLEVVKEKEAIKKELAEMN